MRTISWLGSLLGVVVGCSSIVASVTTVAGQDATPGTETVTETACTVDPRPIDEVLPIWFGTAGTPPPAATEPAPVQSEADLPQGSPADEETVAAIDATFHEFIACFDDGQFLRAFSLATDGLIHRFGPDLSNPNEDTPEEVRALLEAQDTGTPVGEDTAGQRTPVSNARDARVLDDGRVGALFESEGDVIFVIFEKVDDRWLVDDLLDVVEQDGSAAGTPAT